MFRLQMYRVLLSAIGVIFLVGFLSLATNIQAYVLLPFKWSNPGSIRFVSYIQITELSQAFFDAKLDWDATPTRIGLVYDAANPQVKGYNYTEADNNYGKTIPYYSGSTYTSALVYLNWYYLQSQGANFRRSVAGHEWGHALGLNDENSVTNALMNQGRNRNTIYTPQSDDINGINAQYP